MVFQSARFVSLLQQLRRRCRVFALREWNGSAGVILRHDVDLDINAAYAMAQIERQCGIRSSFFVLTTSEFYNVLSPENRQMLAEMASWGFEIGLHFDPTIHGDVGHDEMKQKVDEEASIVQSVTGQRVESVSLHNPSVTGQYPLYGGYRNAYDPRIFNPGCYLSDSRMHFSSDVFQFVEKARTRVVQLLLHPLHYSPDGGGYPSFFCCFLANWIKRLDDTFRVNTGYDAAVRPDLLTLFVAHCTCAIPQNLEARQEAA